MLAAVSTAVNQLVSCTFVALANRAMIHLQGKLLLFSVKSVSFITDDKLVKKRAKI